MQPVLGVPQLERRTGLLGRILVAGQELLPAEAAPGRLYDFGGSKFSTRPSFGFRIHFTFDRLSSTRSHLINSWPWLLFNHVRLPQGTSEMPSSSDGQSPIE